MNIKTLCASLLLLTSSIVVAQEDPDVDLTGSWFNPSMNGSGFLIDDAPEALVVYWFSYSPSQQGSLSTWFSEDSQVWFLAQQEETSEALEIYQPSGTWMSSETFELGESIGQLYITPIDVNNINVAWRFFDWGPCAPVMVSPTWQWCGGELEVTRLTRRIQEEQ